MLNFINPKPTKRTFRTLSVALCAFQLFPGAFQVLFRFFLRNLQLQRSGLFKSQASDPRRPKVFFAHLVSSADRTAPRLLGKSSETIVPDCS